MGINSSCFDHVKVCLNCVENDAEKLLLALKPIVKEIIDKELVIHKQVLIECVNDEIQKAKNVELKVLP